MDSEDCFTNIVLDEPKPPEQHAGRRPGSRATNRSALLSTSEPSPDAESDIPSTHNAPADDPIFLPSKWPVYIQWSSMQIKR